MLRWQPDSLRTQLDSQAALIEETLQAKSRLEQLKRYKDQSPTVSRMAQTGYDAKGTAEQLAEWLDTEDERVLLVRFRAD
ncbi:hypothetical protein GPECTOR_40g515 [Gonium pectorale]|uniref:Uncharacterized protein n=1 Tax=Gonium pectorale TaxID=33097 RepID=A0A150GAB0_GONPE|nr:hypothetical protein GPECTOR_40g515 [Gonium pectorale]|eukprot:KXZ46781.1 hypothetical protein GPECTOR_40g515 [Gonium pectorale]